MDRGVTEIGDLVDATKLLEHLSANRGRLNLGAARFQFVDDVIDQLLQGQQTRRTLFESLGDAARKLATIERLVRPVALDHAQVRALDFLVSRKTISALEALAAPANAGAIARLSGIDNLVITRAALGATHKVLKRN